MLLRWLTLVTMGSSFAYSNQNFDEYNNGNLLLSRTLKTNDQGTILPKIFGSRKMEKPLKISNNRQRYYKPSNKIDSPISPYALYLNQSDQADLYTLAKSARDDGVEETDIKLLMEEYMFNSLTPTQFEQFKKDNAAFEARIARHRRQRRSSTDTIRLYAKLRPKSVIIENLRQLYDFSHNPAHSYKSQKLKQLYT